MATLVSLFGSLHVDLPLNSEGGQQLIITVESSSTNALNTRARNLEGVRFDMRGFSEKFFGLIDEKRAAIF